MTGIRVRDSVADYRRLELTESFERTLGRRLRLPYHTVVAPQLFQDVMDGSFTAHATMVPRLRSSSKEPKVPTSNDVLPMAEGLSLDDIGHFTRTDSACTVGVRWPSDTTAPATAR